MNPLGKKFPPGRQPPSQGFLIDGPKGFADKIFQLIDIVTIRTGKNNSAKKLMLNALMQACQSRNLTHTVISLQRGIITTVRDNKIDTLRHDRQTHPIEIKRNYFKSLLRNGGRQIISRRAPTEQCTFLTTFSEHAYFNDRSCVILRI